MSIFRFTQVVKKCYRSAAGRISRVWSRGASLRGVQFKQPFFHIVSSLSIGGGGGIIIFAKAAVTSAQHDSDYTVIVNRLLGKDNIIMIFFDAI